MRKAGSKVEQACLTHNKARPAAAIEEFEQGETADYFRKNAGYVTELVIMRPQAIDNKKVPPRCSVAAPRNVWRSSWNPKTRRIK